MVLGFFSISNFFINKNSQGRKLSAKKSTYLPYFSFNRRKVFRRFWWIKFLSMILVSPFKWLRLPSLDLDDSFWNNTHGKLLNLSTWIKINLGVFEILKGQLAKHWLYRQTSKLNSIFLLFVLSNLWNPSNLNLLTSSFLRWQNLPHYLQLLFLIKQIITKI